MRNRNEASNRLHRTGTPEPANSDVAIVNTNVSDAVAYMYALKAVRRGLGTAQLSRKAVRRILFAPQKRHVLGSLCFHRLVILVL